MKEAGAVSAADLAEVLTKKMGLAAAQNFCMVIAVGMV